MLCLIGKTQWLHEELEERQIKKMKKKWRKKTFGRPKCNKSIESGYKMKIKDAKDTIGVNWKPRKWDYKKKGWKCIKGKFKD